MLSKTSFFMLTAVLVLGLALSGSTPASACTCFCDPFCSSLGDCCPWCPGGDQTQVTAAVTQTGPGQASITVHNGAATAMQAQLSCIAGVEGLRGLASIDRIKLINVSDGSLLYEFQPSETASQSLEELSALRPRPSAEEDWSGLHGIVPEDVPDGTVASFVIEVTLEEGVTIEGLAEALRRQGSFAGGSGNDDGTLDFHHVFLRDFSHIPVGVGAFIEAKP